MKHRNILIAIALLLTSCEGFQDKDPSLFAAPEVTAVKAVVSDSSIAVELSGAISAIDCKAVKECGFYVSKDSGLSSKTIIAATVKEQFSANFSSEEFGTKYYYQAFISNGKYVITSETQSFEIKPFEYYVSVGKPELVGTELTVAKITVSVQFAEGLSLDEIGFQYSRNKDFSSLTEVAQTTDLDTITQDFEFEPGVEYHIRAYAKKGNNVVYSEAISVTVYCLPEVTTSSTVTGITPTSATCGGEVTADGGAQVTEYGFVYGTSQTPTIETATKKVVGKGTGSFSTTLTDLTTGSTYYVRAYATNSQGTAYGEEVSFKTAKSVTGISLDKTSISLEKGASQTLIATITPSDAYDKAVTWSTSNSSVATVTSNGTVKAIAPGTATITATTQDGSHKATCAVTVISRVTGVSLNKTTITLEKGSSETLIATVLPSDATNKAVTWSSSNTSVAMVSTSGVVTAKAVGSTTISVTTDDGGKKATCAVTVKEKTIPVTGVSLNKTSLSMTVGDKQTLTATISPSTATNKTVTWSSSNTSVATVSSTGVVTAKAVGSTTITVTTSDGGKKATCAVTVTGASPDAGRYISFETTSGENQIAYTNSSDPIILEYSYDKLNWAQWDKSKRLTFSNTSILYVRGDNPYGLNKSHSASLLDCVHFVFHNSNKVRCRGNIMNLLSYSNDVAIPEYCFCYLFLGATCLVGAPELPAKSLARYCYSGMFYDCTSLTSAPQLPATTLADYCYSGMFTGCSSLSSAPQLPAKSLARYCYSGMFCDCTSLTSAPQLPATALADLCYYDMFYGCTSLTSAPQLPATTLSNNCYYGMFSGCTSLTSAPQLPATTLSNNCYYGMFSGCTSLTSAPQLPATILAENCYSGMFRGCTSLTYAPDLPAMSLTDGCYNFMFERCSSLSYVKAMFKGKTAGYTYNWLSGVNPTGTFVKNRNATWANEGIVPSGWTVEYADE